MTHSILYLQDEGSVTSQRRPSTSQIEYRPLLEKLVPHLDTFLVMLHEARVKQRLLLPGDSQLLIYKYVSKYACTFSFYFPHANFFLLFQYKSCRYDGIFSFSMSLCPSCHPLIFLYCIISFAWSCFRLFYLHFSWYIRLQNFTISVIYLRSFCPSDVFVSYLSMLLRTTTVASSSRSPQSVFLSPFHPIDYCRSPVPLSLSHCLSTHNLSCWFHRWATEIIILLKFVKCSVLFRNIAHQLERTLLLLNSCDAPVPSDAVILLEWADRIRRDFLREHVVCRRRRRMLYYLILWIWRSTLRL